MTTFKVGDKVSVVKDRREFWDMCRMTAPGIGYGPFVVEMAEDIPTYDQEGAGHHQFVRIAEEDTSVSGWWFDPEAPDFRVQS